MPPHPLRDDSVPFFGKLSGTVGVDETYVGGKKRGTARGKTLQEKASVFALVERDGNVRSMHMPKVSEKNLRKGKPRKRGHLVPHHVGRAS